MKRRDMIKVLPLSCVGALVLPAIISSAEKNRTSYWHEYQKTVFKKLKKIHETESDTLLEAAHRIAYTIKNGSTCWSQWDLGHSVHEDIFPGRHGDPGILTPGYDANKAKNGDLLLINLFGEALEDPRKKGIFVIGAQAPWCGDTPDAEKLLSKKHLSFRIKPYSDLWINVYLSTLGPEIWLPGAQYPMGALSGILGMTTFWMMNADAVRILTSEGIDVDVKGDEPEFDSSSNYVSLAEPLGDHYFEEVIKQMEQIESEMGTVEKIADTAVTTILNGGKVYVYSKYWEALSVEANTRRGGLTCFYSVDSNVHKDYPGTNKDFVIMGIYSPDDSVDLEYLSRFRKAGSSVASIGPAERDKKYPENSIPQKTDYHLGYMCDTYGILTVPGVRRKICPTSGAIVNQMFYAVCFRMAELFIERTGNTPYIYPNGAIEGPPYAEFGRVHAAGRARGY
ncbi:MAG: hypothetical protein JXB48_17280 [Candidatus Latescibacteria bacterium]|nr:hypothetical protein [Candidatus Latescibacterota bacterium]